MMDFRVKAVIDKMIMDEDYRYLVQTIICTMIFGFLGFIMFAINVMTHTSSLAVITGIMALLGSGLTVYIYLTKRYIGARRVMGAAFIVAVISFVYNGGIDGFSPFWACMMPFMALFTFGMIRGTLVAGTLFLIIILMLWTPIESLLVYEYTSTFIMRFPLLFLGCFGAAFFMEYFRDQTMEKLNATVEELEGITRIDALTGIENRRAFQSRIEDMWEIFHNKDNYMSLLMVDIDFFKKYNDNYGHLKGDEVLKEVASIITETANEDRGFTSRWGGEEFVCLLPFADSKQAVAVGEKILKAVESASIPHAYTELADQIITVSVGTATVNATLAINPRELVQEADQSLYEAKTYGRNRLGRNRTLG